MAQDRTGAAGSRWRWYGGLAGLAVLAVVAGALLWPAETRAPGASAGGVRTAPAAPAGVARRETRPTLDPARFVGKARLAHQVAREMPDVLDRLYCYCECDKHRGHRSLLSCYVDGHAAT
jgi:hypothetical protein